MKINIAQTGLDQSNPYWLVVKEGADVLKNIDIKITDNLEKRSEIGIFL